MGAFGPATLTVASIHFRRAVSKSIEEGRRFMSASLEFSLEVNDDERQFARDLAGETSLSRLCREIKY